MMQQQKLAV